MISTDSLQLIRGTQTLLNLEIQKGTITHLIGPNGSGKSTLFQTILGILPEKSGEISIDGASIKSFSGYEVSTKLSYVPQRFDLLENLKVSTLIAISNITHSDVISALDLEELLDQKSKELSSGQLQRINVAIGLGRFADYYLLDEPFAGLDVKYQERVNSIISARKSAGSGFMISTHQDFSADISITIK